MCASFGSDACDARLVEALSLEIASLRPSRLRAAAAVRKLRHEHETFPSPTTIITTIDEVSDADIIATAAVTLAWMGKADRGRWMENHRSGRRRVGGLGRHRAGPDGTAVMPARPASACRTSTTSMPAPACGRARPAPACRKGQGLAGEMRSPTTEVAGLFWHAVKHAQNVVTSGGLAAGSQ